VSCRNGAGSLVPSVSTFPINFEFNANTIRVVEIDGEPWFVAQDVGKALDINRIDNLMRNLSDDEKQRTPHIARGMIHSNAKLISESGLYKLIMRSDKPNARAFQDWVARVVLPAIHKHGGYIMGEEKVSTGEISEDELVLRAMGRFVNFVQSLGLGTSLEK